MSITGSSHWRTRGKRSTLACFSAHAFDPGQVAKIIAHLTLTGD